MSNKTVTIIVPNYNGNPFLLKALQSLDQLCYSDYLVQVWDDGSTDDSVEVAAAFCAQRENFEVIQNKNVGIGKSWNRAVSSVSTEFFSILHCDDEYEPDYLIELMCLMKRYPRAAIGHCAAVCIDQNSRQQESFLETYKRVKFFPCDQGAMTAESAFNSLLSGNFINCPSVIYRTELVKKVGLFNVELDHCLDWDFWFRVCLNDFEIAYTRKQLFRYRRHAGNASRNNSKLLVRYREEHELLTNMTRSGTLKFSWSDREPDLRPIFLGALSDIKIDLANGQYLDANKKSELLWSLGVIKRFTKLMLDSLIMMRKPGGVALSVAINSAVYLVAATTYFKRAAS